MSDSQSMRSRYPFDVQRLTAFCDEDIGGNPAGVVIGERMPDAELMQRVATEVGYSETAFLAEPANGWRVRYFAPAGEVPFCGHATVAGGASGSIDGDFGLIKQQKPSL